jgi:hypothetical protein
MRIFDRVLSTIAYNGARATKNCRLRGGYRRMHSALRLPELSVRDWRAGRKGTHLRAEAMRKATSEPDDQHQ